MDGVQGLAGSLEILQGEAGDEVPGPNRLQRHGLGKGEVARFGQGLERRALVARIAALLNEAVLR